MFGLGKKARFKALNERFGNIMYVLSNSGDGVAIKAMEGFVMGMAIGMQQRDAAKGQWDANLSLLLARELEKTATSLHNAGDSDYAKGIMLASTLEECQCLNLPEAWALAARLQQILAGARKELGARNLA